MYVQMELIAMTMGNKALGRKDLSRQRKWVGCMMNTRRLLDLTDKGRMYLHPG